MVKSLRVAVGQVSISADPLKNAEMIVSSMRRAAADGADLALFPEGALSGYVKRQIHDLDMIDWDAIDAAKRVIQKEAQALFLWVVIGCVRDTEERRPRNSLIIINALGEHLGAYDKRILSYAEAKDWFVPGAENLIIEVNGIRIGFALCIELRFPELFLAHAEAGADLVLVGSYSDEPFDEIQARALAASYNLFFALSVPNSSARTGLHGLGIGPDGRILARGVRGDERFVFDVEPDDPEWDVPLRRAKSWRAQVRTHKRLILLGKEG